MDDIFRCGHRAKQQVVATLVHTLRLRTVLLPRPHRVLAWRLRTATGPVSLMALIIDRFAGRHWSFRLSEIESVTLAHRADGTALSRDRLVITLCPTDSSAGTWRLLTKRGAEILGRFASLGVRVVQPTNPASRYVGCRSKLCRPRSYRLVVRGSSCPARQHPRCVFR